MNDNLKKLLNNLEPIIDNKCLEIKEKKLKKEESITFMVLCFCFAIIPCILLIFNINGIYFMVGIIIIILLKFFIKLPDILKRNLEAKCYE